MKNEESEIIMQISGKAYHVFNAIKKMCRLNPDSTLKQAAKIGQLPENLKDTKPLKIGEDPYVYLDEGFEKN